MTLGERTWSGASLLLVAIGAILVLALFLVLRPLELESPASGGARAMLRVDHALGATVEPVDAAIAKRSGLQDGNDEFVVTSVANGGPAAAAGLRVGDVIKSIGGKPADQLSLTGHSVPISIWRGGRTIVIDVDFGSELSGRSA